MKQQFFMWGVVSHNPTVLTRVQVKLVCQPQALILEFKSQGVIDVNALRAREDVTEPVGPGHGGQDFPQANVHHLIGFLNSSWY